MPLTMIRVLNNLVYIVFLNNKNVKSTQSTTKHRLYWQRWPVLIFYLVASIVNSIPGEITIPIANELQVIYDTSETFITMAATSYLMM